MQTLSNKLVTLRKQNNLTQQQLAQKINYSDKVISKWERGESIPDIQAIQALASEYKLSVDELLSGTNTAEARPKFTNKNLKLYGLFLHIAIVSVILMMFVGYLCHFGYRWPDGSWWVHTAPTIVMSCVLGLLLAATIVDMVFAHVGVKRVATVSIVAGLVFAIILSTSILCMVYGTMWILNTELDKYVIVATILSMVSVGYGCIFNRK